MALLSSFLTPALLAPALLAQEVTLPLPEFRELRARAYPPPEVPPPPPAPVAFEAAALEVAVGEASARVALDLTLSLYGEGWQRLPLPPVGSYVASDFGGLEGRLEASGEALVVRGEGRHRVRLEAVAPVARDEGATRPTWRLALPLPAAAVVAGAVTAPAEVREVEAAGGAVLRREGPGRWAFVGPPGGEMALTLTGEAVVPQRAELPLRFEATSATDLRLTRTRTQARGWVVARVIQGELAALELPLPPGYEVVSLEGGQVAGWDVEDGVLQVTPAAPVAGALAVELEMTAPPAAEAASLVLAPRGALRTLAAAKVSVSGDGLLTLAAPGAGRRPDGREEQRLPNAFRSAPGEALVVPPEGEPPRWQVTWAEATEVLAAQVDRLLVHYLVGEAGWASFQLWAEVRNTGAEELAFRLPPAAELVAARRDGAELEPGRGAGGWAVPLAVGEGSQVIHLTGLLPLDLPGGDGELSLPLPELSAPAGRVEVRAWLPPGRSYSLVEAERAGPTRPPPSQPGPVTQRASQLSQQVALYTKPDLGAPLLPEPPGYRRVEAAWSALSPAPPPLRVEVEKERRREEWR